MAIVSDIEIRLMANVAQLQQDMSAARRAVDSSMAGISKAAGVAKMAIGALAGVLSIGAFAGWIKGAIDATDAAADLSARTGIALEDIGALQLAFKKGGMEAGDMEGSMVKLSKAIAEGNDSFARIGVSTKTSNGALRESKDVLYDVADRFANLEDGTAKTALAMEIFGKSGAAMIPLLNDGSAGLREMADMADKLGITFDEKTVDAAGKFNDTLDFMALAGQGVARQLAAQLLPTLNSLSGSFLKLITEGDGVRKVADGIGAVFKVLYTIGVGVAQVFNVAGSIIGLAMAQVVAVMQGDFKTAASYGQIVWDDLSSSIKASAVSIKEVWTGTGGEVVAALAETTKKTGAIADKVDKDAQKQVDAYKALISSIKEKVAATGAEAASLQPLTDAQKLSIKLDEDIASGKIKLTAVQMAAVQSAIAQYAANLDLLQSQKDFKDMAAELAKADEARQAENKKAIDGARQEAEAQENLVLMFGMTKTAIMNLEVARLEDQLAQKDSNNLTWEQIETLKQLIFYKKRAAEASASNDILEAEKDATKLATDSQLKMIDSVEKTWHDTFVSITNGGAGVAERLWKSFKNGFFDLLYQMTLKPFVVNVATSITGTGASAAALAGGGAQGGGLMSAIGTATGLSSAFSAFGGTLATGFMNTIAGTGFGASLTAGSAMLSGGFTASGLGMMAGAIAPYAIAAIAGSALLKKAFGRGPKETTGQGISGTFGADSFSGSSFTEWIKKGGWFRSDKKGVDTSPLAAETADALNSTYKMLKDSTSAFATALGVPTDAITGYTKQIKLALTGDATKDQKLLADLFAEMGDELATRVLPNISDFIAQGETAAGTLRRLVVEIQTVDAVLQTLGVSSQQAFGAVGTASLAARDRLVSLSGGLEALAAQTTFFAENFLTDAERIAPAQKAVTEGLAKLGYAGLSTTEEFAAAVKDLASSGKLATQSGAETYAGLLALAPAFKALTDYMDQTRAAAEALAASQADALRATAGDMFSALQRAIDVRKKAVTAAFDSLMAGIESSITASAGRVSRLQDLSGALSSASVPGAGIARQQAQAQILAALAIAKASGVLPDAASLRDALQAAGGATQDEFSTVADFQRNQLMTANSIIELGALTDTQLTVEQRTLAALQDQKALAQSNYAAEIARYDEMLVRAQMQIDAINGVRTDVQSVPVAFAQFANSILAALGNKSIAAQPSVGPGNQIEALYNSVLGRASDSEGLAFWSQAIRDGHTLESIKKQFMESPEYQAMQNSSMYGTQQAGNMGGVGSAMLTELQTMNARLQNVENATRQQADQFDSVSQGGTTLYTAAA